MSAVSDSGGELHEFEVFHFDGVGGVALTMYNTDEVCNWFLLIFFLREGDHLYAFILVCKVGFGLDWHIWGEFKQTNLTGICASGQFII